MLYWTSLAELSKGGTAFLLEDRWGDARFLVVRQAWYNLAAGSVLILQSNTQASGVEEDSDAALFLSVVLGAIH